MSRTTRTVDATMHLAEDDTTEGSAAAHYGQPPYPVIKVGPRYPGITIFPDNIGQVVQMADACLDSVHAMLEQGSSIDADIREALARLSVRAHVLAFDEQAEAEAARMVPWGEAMAFAQAVADNPESGVE